MDGIHEAIHDRQPESIRGARLPATMAPPRGLTKSDTRRQSAGVAGLLRFWAVLLISASLGAAVLQALGPPRTRHSPPADHRADAVQLPIRAAIAERSDPAGTAKLIPSIAAPVAAPEPAAPPSPLADLQPPPGASPAPAPAPAAEAAPDPGPAAFLLLPSRPAPPPPILSEPPPAKAAVMRGAPDRPAAVVRTARPVGPASHDAPVFAVSGGIAPIEMKCRNMLGRAQLGEELSDADRAILRAGCKERR